MGTILVALAVLAAASYGVLAFLRRSPHVPFQDVTITQITDSGNLGYAAISLDGKYLLSTTAGGSRESLWLRVHSTGGRAEVVPGLQNLSSTEWYGLAFSPDGALLAGFVTVTDSRTRLRSDRCLLLSNYAGHQSVIRSIALRPNIFRPGEFTPDSKSVAYPILENGVGNIWVQPVTGAPGHQITNFDSEKILEAHWSPDGKWLAIVRGNFEFNVVLFRESNQ